MNLRSVVLINMIKKKMFMLIWKGKLKSNERRIIKKKEKKKRKKNYNREKKNRFAIFKMKQFTNK